MHLPQCSVVSFDCFNNRNYSKFTANVKNKQGALHSPALLHVIYVDIVTRFELVFLQHLQQLLHRGITGQQLALLFHGSVSLAEVIILRLCASMDLHVCVEGSRAIAEDPNGRVLSSQHLEEHVPASLAGAVKAPTLEGLQTTD